MAGKGPNYLKQHAQWAAIQAQLGKNGGVLADPNPQGTAMGKALKGVSLNPVGEKMARQLQGVNLNKPTEARGKFRRGKLPTTDQGEVEQMQEPA